MPMSSGNMYEFLSRYAQEFATGDAAKIATYFAYPLQTISAEESSASVSAFSEAEWKAVLDRLLSAYRQLGVARAKPLWSEVDMWMPGLHFLSVTWRLLDCADRLIYTFDAVYIVADTGPGLRVAALAHNERDGLDAALREAERREVTATSTRGRTGGEAHHTQGC